MNDPLTTVDVGPKRIVNLVIGLGEIGASLKSLLKADPVLQVTYGRDVEEVDLEDVPDVLHICYPYTPRFVQITQNYIEQYNPDLVIVYSTVPVGTCEKIGKSVVHSPVEGRHPDLSESMATMPRWMGSADPEALNKAKDLWRNYGIPLKPVKSSRFTELLKIRSTAKYGINLVWADYDKELSDKHGMDYELVMEFDRDYNYLYRTLGHSEFQRYIVTPPGGEIGGHCVVPNAKLLKKDINHPYLDKIIKMEKK